MLYVMFQSMREWTHNRVGRKRVREPTSVS